jgi:hypothetical protein
MWLALLLPMAQSAVAWHGVSHGLAEDASQGDSRQAAHLSVHCDLCLMAASLAGSAPAPAVPALAVLDGHAAPPVVRPTSVWLPPTLSAYSSRAPPSSSR